MFAVKKYSDVLDSLRRERNIPAHFQHNLISIDAQNRVATFKNLAHNAEDASTGPETVQTEYTILHATPPMGPLSALAQSPLADQAGWISVDDGTLQHKNPEYKNVFALGDCSSLPTSKTAAAVTAQTPVVVENVFRFVETGELKEAARYDGYTSCPVSESMFLYSPREIDTASQLLTGYGQLLLAEFKYGLVPKESFAELIGDQAKPRRCVGTSPKYIHESY
jgi:sulfide:quinone oxidoreductase